MQQAAIFLFSVLFSVSADALQKPLGVMQEWQKKPFCVSEVPQDGSISIKFYYF